MEDSIRRAEKLVYAANSALAEMKYNLTFEEYEKKSKNLKVPDREKKNLFLDEELQKSEQEFKAEANEMLLKMDKILDPSQYFLSRKTSSQSFKVRERMKEINYKLQGRREEDRNSLETEKSRLKLLSLINQKEIEIPSKFYTKQIPFSSNSENYKSTSSTVVTTGAPSTRKYPILRKTDSLPTIIGNSLNKMKPSEELKNKLLETQEIVDRGFETARNLKKKVESLTQLEKKVEKTPSTIKTCFSENLNTRKTLDWNRKCDSNETIKLTKFHKCKKHQEKEKDKSDYFKEKKSNSEEMIKNDEKKDSVVGKNSLISVKRAEEKKLKHSRFNFEKLPNVHIRGGLQIQRIQSLEILPEDTNVSTSDVNVCVKKISHEEIEREKINKIAENIEKEKSFIPKPTYANSIECFNCGKLCKIEENFANPEEIDNLLMKCGFNVSDPRIDEFVEKYKLTKKKSITFAEEKSSGENLKQFDIAKKLNENGFREKETNEKWTQKDIETERNLNLQEFSEELSQAYKEKASQLEDDYEEFENILRGLFKKIDRSRKIFDKFESCHLSSFDNEERKNVAEKTQKLTTTKPFIISLTNSEEKKSVEKSTLTENVSSELYKENIFRKKEKKKRSPKKNIKYDFKDKISENYPKKKILKKFSFENKKIKDQKKEEANTKIQTLISPDLSTTSEISEIKEPDKKNVSKVETKFLCNPSELSESSDIESILNEGCDSIFSIQNEDMKTENDYESDFEGESIKNEDSKSVKSDKIEKELKRKEKEELKRKEKEELKRKEKDEELEREKEEESEKEQEEELEREEEREQNLTKCVKKLSTILEVDSEVEKKISEIEFTDPLKEKSISIIVEEDVQELPYDSDAKTIQTSINISNRILENNSGSPFNLHKKVNISETKSEKKECSDSSLSPKASFDKLEKCKNLENHKKSDFQTENVSYNLSNATLTKNNPSSTVVTALKDVLSSLQDQFHKTQFLAEKLTANINNTSTETKLLENCSSKNETEILSVSSPVIRNLNLSSKELLTNLQNNRMSLNNNGNQRIDTSDLFSEAQKKQDYLYVKSPEFVKDNLIFKNSSSASIQLDNLNSVSTIKKKNEQRRSESSSNSDISFIKLPLSSSRRECLSKLDSAKGGLANKEKNVSPISLEDGSENFSYSEGEIINSDISENDKSSSQSIGEVISEKFSEASLTE